VCWPSKKAKSIFSFLASSFGHDAGAGIELRLGIGRKTVFNPQIAENTTKFPFYLQKIHAERLFTP